MNKKEKILFEACKLFAKKGYKKTTVAEICKSANVNIASVNYYFQSKDNLYKEAFKYAYNLAEKQSPILPILELSASPEKKLYIFIKTVIKRNYSEKNEKYLQMFFLHEASEPTGIVQNLVNSIKSKYRKVLFDILKEIVKDVDNENFPLIAYSIISQCLFLRFNPIAKESMLKKYKPDELVKILSEHIYKFSISAIKHYNL